MALSMRMRNSVLTHLRCRGERGIERPRRAFTGGDWHKGEAERTIERCRARTVAGVPSSDDHRAGGSSFLPRQRFSSTGPLSRRRSRSAAAARWAGSRLFQFECEASEILRNEIAEAPLD